MNLYCSLTLIVGSARSGSAGGCDARAPARAEPTLEYCPRRVGDLTPGRDPAGGPCQAGSLTGAVASQNVTEARKGPLRTVGNRSQSARVQAGLTARPTSRAETKVGSSDPAAQSGMAVAQRIKGTPGITG